MIVSNNIYQFLSCFIYKKKLKWLLSGIIYRNSMKRLWRKELVILKTYSANRNQLPMGSMELLLLKNPKVELFYA